jgi:two-component system LytT family response regulator
MPVATSGGTRLVVTDEIDWVEAAGVHVVLHVEGEKFLYRGDLAEVAGHLDPFRFIRVHRSAMVNLGSIASLERRFGGEFGLVLKNGARLTLSRDYRAEVERVLGQSL